MRNPCRILSIGQNTSKRSAAMTGKKLEEYEQMCAKIASDKAKLEEEEKSLQALEQKTKEKKNR